MSTTVYRCWEIFITSELNLYLVNIRGGCSMRFHHVGSLSRWKSEFRSSLMEIDSGWLCCVSKHSVENILKHAIDVSLLSLNMLISLDSFSIQKQLDLGTSIKAKRVNAIHHLTPACLFCMITIFFLFIKLTVYSYWSLFCNWDICLLRCLVITINS